MVWTYRSPERMIDEARGLVNDGYVVSFGDLFTIILEGGKLVNTNVKREFPENSRTIVYDHLALGGINDLLFPFISTTKYEVPQEIFTGGNSNTAALTHLHEDEEIAQVDIGDLVTLLKDGACLVEQNIFETVAQTPKSAGSLGSFYEHQVEFNGKLYFAKTRDELPDGVLNRNNKWRK